MSQLTIKRPVRINFFRMIWLVLRLPQSEHESTRALGKAEPKGGLARPINSLAKAHKMAPQGLGLMMYLRSKFRKHVNLPNKNYKN